MQNTGNFYLNRPVRQKTQFYKGTGDFCVAGVATASWAPPRLLPPWGASAEAVSVSGGCRRSHGHRPAGEAPTVGCGMSD